MPLDRKDCALLAIAAADGHPLCPVQLQKSLFLLGRELGDLVRPRYYAFEPYNYGPFDVSVYHDAERLARDGLVTITRPAYMRYNELQRYASGAECCRGAA